MEKQGREEQREIRKVLYDGSFKFASGIIGLLLTVLWWGITHQLSSLESQIKDIQLTTQQIKSDQSQNYAYGLQTRGQVDSNTKRVDRLEVLTSSLQDRVTKFEAIDGYRNGKR